MPPSSASTPAIFQAFSSPALWKTVGVGAFAGFVAFCISEVFSQMTHQPGMSRDGVRLIVVSSVWVALIGIAIGIVLLAWENSSSLRGKWFRDMGPGIPLFAFLGLISGAAAQFLYAVGMGTLVGSAQGASFLLTASLVRGVGWGLFGVGVGASIGLLRSDTGQIVRGALGGAIGGFLGGLLFNFVNVIIAGSDSAPRLVGVVLLGAFLGGATRLVQETLRSAWLMGISTGPYEGKEYPLGKARLTVGRSDKCDLSLFRDESLAPQLGALVFQNGAWSWQGESIVINGVPQTSAVLSPGARLQIGNTLFRFNDRSKNAPRDPLGPPVVVPNPAIAAAATNAVSSQAPTPAMPTAPVATAWTFAPAVGNSLTGFRLSPEMGTATIGRSAGNDWVLSDDGTSGKHARIDRTFDGLAIMDLGSTNGTWINGQRMAPNIAVSLRGGETIRFGRTQWMVRRGG